MKSFEQLDTKAFEKYFSGIGQVRSVSLYLKTANIFLQSFPEKFEELKEHLKAERSQEAKVIAHRLKGSLLTLGGNDLAEVFRQIEMELDPQNRTHFVQVLEKLDSSISRFLKELNEWMQDLKSTLPQEDNV